MEGRECGGRDARASLQKGERKKEVLGNIHERNGTAGRGDE